MKSKAILSLLLLLFSLMVAAQQQRYVSKVVDAQTLEPLPFASVYVSQGSSTISNAEGMFGVECSPTSTVRITYVGYQTKTLRASALTKVVALEPLAKELDEVKVKPVWMKDIIRKATKEALRQIRKYGRKRATFFYRQTAFSDSTCYELLEAFLSGKSAVVVEDLELLKGRFAGIQPDSMHRYSFYSNFFSASSVPMVSKSMRMPGNIYPDLMPLSPNYDKYYDVDYDIFPDSAGRVLALRFKPKEEIEKTILDVTIYVDENTGRLRKMEGMNRNLVVTHKDYEVVKEDTTIEVIEYATKSLMEFHLTVNMTEEHGFNEVQSVYIDEQHEHNDLHITTRSILYNVGSEKKKQRGNQMDHSSNLQMSINEQGYDPEFWRQNEVVMRTPVEQQVQQLFEEKDLFGVFNLNE